MQDPPTDPTGLQFRGAFSGFPANSPASRENMPNTHNSGTPVGGKEAMAPEQPSRPPLRPAWPEPADPPTEWARDPLGTSPRLPLPADEPSRTGDARVPPGSGWERAMAQSADPPPARGTGREQPPAGGGDGATRPSPTPADNAVWPPVPPPDSAVWPPVSPAENTAWLPSIPADDTPAGGATRPPASSRPSAPQDPLFAPSWVNGPAQPADQPPARPSGGPAPGGEKSAPGGFGVPNGPSVWAMAATAPEETPPAPPWTPSHPTRDASEAPLSPPASSPEAPSPYGRAPRHGAPSSPGGPGRPEGPPPQEEASHTQPGRHLSRDPSDPYKPFVTAGQISGPKTPPPERQQELWDTVFGDNYQAMGDEDDFDAPGKPVWVFALAGSVVIALVGALFWAFMAGPLAAAKEEPSPRTSPSATPKKPTKAQSPGRLPRFPGKGSPVEGVLSDQAAAVSVARLGAPWQQDQRRTVPVVYGFTTRQYVPAGTDSAGREQFAQLMLGTLSPRLKSRYTPERPAPAINAVASGARKKFFPEDNSARKTAQQTLSVHGLRGQLAAYEITAGGSKTVMVVAILNTGADLPAVVYMSVPEDKRELLPDITTVFTSIRPAAS
ncbi:hypothetical protein GCM10017673_49850 [Streptosporangium violaceochromogenes]|nr:hypothetical protein GCM10017673_49850 [Streptosporangium violaceochromogenes]